MSQVPDPVRRQMDRPARSRRILDRDWGRLDKGELARRSMRIASERTRGLGAEGRMRVE